MISAKEMREFCPRTVEDKVRDLLEYCKELAQQGKYECLTAWQYEKDKDLWVEGAYSNTQEYIAAKKLLEDLGYRVGFYYNAGSIAVDMYTIISWKP